MTIQTEIKVSGFELTPAIRQYAEEKMLQLDRLIDSSQGNALAEVEVEKTTDHHRRGDVFRAEIRLQADGRKFYAAATTGDLYASLDKVKDEVTRQITSARGKQQTLFRRGARKLKDFLRFGR